MCCYVFQFDENCSGILGVGDRNVYFSSYVIFLFYFWVGGIGLVCFDTFVGLNEECVVVRFYLRA